MTALRFDAVLGVKLVHRIQLRAEPAKRHNNIYEVREISFDSLRVLSPFVAVRIGSHCHGFLEATTRERFRSRTV